MVIEFLNCSRLVDDIEFRMVNVRPYLQIVKKSTNFSRIYMLVEHIMATDMEGARNYSSIVQSSIA